MIKPGSAGPSADKGPVSRARAWYLVGLLSALLLASFVDRLILTVLVAPMTADLGISDQEIGLLMGFGFLAAAAFAVARRSNRLG